MWRVYVAAALRYPWTFVTPGAEAAAVWIPPGGEEMTGEEAPARASASFIEEAAGPEAAEAAREIEARFAAAHPSGSFYHLTILGTRSSHRGKGLGMGLLAETLARVDAEGAAAYLESTNPANLGRYGNTSFETRAEIAMPSGCLVYHVAPGPLTVIRTGSRCGPPRRRPWRRRPR